MVLDVKLPAKDLTIDFDKVNSFNIFNSKGTINFTIEKGTFVRQETSKNQETGEVMGMAQNLEDAELEPRCLSFGASEVFKKPLDFSAMLSCINSRFKL